MFGYSVKVFSCPLWKLPSHPETGQVPVCVSVNTRRVWAREYTTGRRSHRRAAGLVRSSGTAHRPVRRQARLSPSFFDLLIETT